MQRPKSLLATVTLSRFIGNLSNFFFRNRVENTVGRTNFGMTSFGVPKQRTTTMKTVIKRPKSVIERMAEDKKKIEQYIVSGDELQKPEGVVFVKPVAIPARTVSASRG